MRTRLLLQSDDRGGMPDRVSNLVIIAFLAVMTSALIVQSPNEAFAEEITMNVGCGRYQAMGVIAGNNLRGRGGDLNDIRHLEVVVNDIRSGRIASFSLPELERADVTLSGNNLRFVQIWKPGARLWLRWDHAGPPSFEIYSEGWGQKNCAPINLNETRIR